MSNITSKFNRSGFGVIVPYQNGNYEAYVSPTDEGVLVAYHKAFECMPAFESDTFATIQDADEYIRKELKGVQLRKVRNLAGVDQY